MLVKPQGILCSPGYYSPYSADDMQGIKGQPGEEAETECHKNIYIEYCIHVYYRNMKREKINKSI